MTPPESANEREVSFFLPSLKAGARVTYLDRTQVVSHIVLSDSELLVSLIGFDKPIPASKVRHEWRVVTYTPRNSR